MKKLKLLLLPICLFAFSLCNLSAADQSTVASALGFKSEAEVEKFLDNVELYYDSLYYLFSQTLTSDGVNADAALREVNENGFHKTLNMFQNKIFSEEHDPLLHNFSYDLRAKIELGKSRPPVTIMPGTLSDVKKAKERILKFQKEYGNIINKFLDNHSTSKPELK